MFLLSQANYEIFLILANLGGVKLKRFYLDDQICLNKPCHTLFHTSKYIILNSLFVIHINYVIPDNHIIVGLNLLNHTAYANNQTN